MHYLLLILTLFVAAGCGSKGDLYLPEKPAATQQPVDQASDGEGEQQTEEEKDDQP